MAYTIQDLLRKTFSLIKQDFATKEEVLTGIPTKHVNYASNFYITKTSSSNNNYYTIYIRHTFPSGSYVKVTSDGYNLIVAETTENAPWTTEKLYSYSKDTYIDRVVLKKIDSSDFSIDELYNVLQIMLPVSIDDHKLIKDLSYENWFDLLITNSTSTGYTALSTSNYVMVYNSSYSGLRATTLIYLKSGDQILNGLSKDYWIGIYGANGISYCQTGLDVFEIQDAGFYYIYISKYGSAFTSSDISSNLTIVRAELINSIKDINISNNTETINYNDSYYVNGKTINVYNPYKNIGSVKLKGQMHCHSTNSDGLYSPYDVVNKYIDAGYDFMTITDHNCITNDPSITSDIGNMIWIGRSYEDTHTGTGNQHCNVYDLDIEKPIGTTSMYKSTNTPESIIDTYVTNGKSVICFNHPDDWDVYASEEKLKSLPKGFSFIETFNGCDVYYVTTIQSASNLPSTAMWNEAYYITDENVTYYNRSTDVNSPTWEIFTKEVMNNERGFGHMLDVGHKVFALAVDDFHSSTNFNRGWVVVFANSRSKESIWNALTNGCFYASSGVEISDVSFLDGVYTVVNNGSNDTVTIFYGEGNTVLKTVTGNSASYIMNGSEKYVRSVVTDGNLKAWTQPVWNISSKKQYEF